MKCFLSVLYLPPDKLGHVKLRGARLIFLLSVQTARLRRVQYGFAFQKFALKNINEQLSFFKTIREFWNMSKEREIKALYFYLIYYNRFWYYRFFYLSGYLSQNPDFFWRDWLMTKVEFSFYSTAHCPWQYIQVTDHRDIKGTLLVHFMKKHNFLLENTLVQSIQITLEDQLSNRNAIFSTQNKTPVFHLGKILSGFSFL